MAQLSQKWAQDIPSGSSCDRYPPKASQLGLITPGLQLIRKAEITAFAIPSIEKWYPFHIPSLELCIPFNCLNYE